jgi:hypothetical protein
MRCARSWRAISPASRAEAKEIVEKATEFCEFVELWINSKFPTLKR